MVDGSEAIPHDQILRRATAPSSQTSSGRDMEGVTRFSGQDVRSILDGANGSICAVSSGRQFSHETTQHQSLQGGPHWPVAALGDSTMVDGSDAIPHARILRRATAPSSQTSSGRDMEGVTRASGQDVRSILNGANGSTDIVSNRRELRDIRQSREHGRLPSDSSSTGRTPRIPTMIIGDVNAKSMLWGCDSECSRGRELEDIFNEFELVCINDGSYTRIAAPPAQFGIPDITMCSRQLALSCLTWKVTDDSMGSDHLPIITSLVPITTPLSSRTRIQTDLTKGMDWNKYKAEAEVLFTNNESLATDSVNDKLQVINSLIYTCARRSQSQSQPATVMRRPPNPWWDRELSTYKQRKTEAYKLLRRVGTREAYQNYLQSEKEFKDLVQLKKREAWKKFCSSLTGQSSLTEVWKMARKFRTPTCTPDMNNLVRLEWLPKFADNLAPAFAKTAFRAQNNEYCESNKWLSEPFTMNELENALEHSNNSSPGLDGIKFPLLRQLPVVAKQQLLQLYNDCLLKGYCPKIWQKTKVIPILKPDKNPREASSYRPICLLQCSRKILERMLVVRLEYWAENNHILSKSQYGFRKGKSTRDCLSIFTTDTKLAFEKKQEVLACFIDITGAYDNVLVDVLCQKLNRLGVPTGTVMLLWEMLSERDLYFSLINDENLVRTTFIGLPQGSVLSPFLYNIYTSEIDQCVTQHSCEILQYADDIVIYISGRILNQMLSNMQSGLNQLYDWLFNLGLTINITKTTTMLLSRKHINAVCNLHINGMPLEQKQQVKYLGLNIQRKLNWSTHVSTIVSKGKRRLNLLRSLTGVYWGAHPECLLILYKCFIRPLLEYGCNCFAQVARTHFIKMERVQWAALRTSLGLFPSTHTQTLEILAGVPPLEARFDYITYRYIVSVMTKPNHQLEERLRSVNHLSMNIRAGTIYHEICDTVGEVPKENLFTFNLDSLIFRPQIMNTVRMEIPKKSECVIPEVVMQIFLRAIETYPRSNIVYTDGSGREGTTSIGVYSELNQFGYKLKEPGSIFTAELTAIHQACILLFAKSPDRYLIVTDSLSSIEALRTTGIRPRTNFRVFECKDALRGLLEQGLDISLMWVPSHKGIHGNECADKLASSALDNEDSISCHIAADFYKLARKYCAQVWQNKWNSSDMGRFTYSIFPRVQWLPWFHKGKFERSFIVGVSRLAANHTRFRSHLERISIVDSAMCDCGVDFETADHVLWRCEMFVNQRQTLIANLEDGDVDMPIRDMIALMRFVSLQRVMKFFKEIEIMP